MGPLLSTLGSPTCTPMLATPTPPSPTLVSPPSQLLSPRLRPRQQSLPSLWPALSSTLVASPTPMDSLPTPTLPTTQAVSTMWALSCPVPRNANTKCHDL